MQRQKWFKIIVYVMLIAMIASSLFAVLGSFFAG